MRQVQTCVSGPPTALRGTVARLALSVVEHTGLFTAPELAALKESLGVLSTFGTITRRVERAADQSFLYWHRDIFPIYLKQIYDSPAEAHRLPYALAALQDVIPSLLRAGHTVRTSRPG